MSSDSPIGSQISNQTNKSIIDFNKLNNVQSFSDILQTIFLGISSTQGVDFFESLVFHLTQVLEIDYAFITQLENDNSTIALAGAFRGKRYDEYVYKLKNTPHEIVLEQGKYTCYDNLKKVFVNDSFIQKNNIESYIGTALYDQKGEVTGLLCVMNSSPLGNKKILPKIIEIFAVSAARELKKIRTEKELEKINIDLEKLVRKKTNQLEETNDNLRKEIKRNKKIQSQLIKQETQFKELVYNIENGIIIVNQEGKIKFANPAALKIFEQPLHSLLDYEFGLPIINDKPVELEILKSNNQTGIVEMNITLTEWENESVYLVSFREITMRKKAEEEIIKAKLEADSANQAKTEFLTNVSHELRTPMNAILGFSQLLKLKLKVDDPLIYEYIDTIYNNSNILLSLINELLDINQAEAGKIELNYCGFSVRQFLGETIKLFSSQLSKKTVNLLIDIEDNVPKFINFDSLRLRQILINLISNSLKFTTKGHIKILISIQELYLNSCTLKIFVEDTGIGIKDEDKERIFQVFTQSKGQDNYRYGGNGLGLFITQKITECLGGTITLESEWGKGSTFTIIFPNVEILDSRENLEEISYIKTLNDLDPVNILVINDVFDDCNIIKGYFAETEHHLLFANNKEMAVNLLNNYCIDILFIRLTLNNIENDLKTSKFLHKQYQTIPIIAITDIYLNIKEHNNSLFQGFLEYPINYSQLVEVLSNILRQKEEQETKIEFSITASDYEKINNLSNLLQELQKIQENSWKLIRRRMILSELQQFCHDLKDLGQTYHCQILVNYSEMLASHVRFFDIEKFSKVLDNFPQIRVSLLNYFDNNG
ncbi:ATP-binding protein [Crocosphaera chwakensis]|uniref:Circadian input-output histidine kinase CikA n=1 Tax=Crocosphaera chwakensis CCY0110 TaxID=391612 RepID=A3IRX6_9CHRO|nr:ATP-binding protein [Crocosphaera chwakensis]EAZ90827.1 PAS/PAC sensor hybrid histidine kinase [Crocosphaera chwakensis CCY0110]